MSMFLFFIFQVNVYGLNGMGLEALDLYRQMPNYLRDDVSHICVLNACSHSGLVDQARSIFNEISNKTEKITTTMVFFFISLINLLSLRNHSFHNLG